MGDPGLLFRYFEKRLPPYPDAEPALPPQGFFAFLWACTDGVRGKVAWLAGLTALMSAFEALLFALLGWFSGHVGAWLKRHGRAGLWLDRIAGTVFVGLGIKLAAGN